jgi:7-cyano-7-deazaguanine synthase
MKSVIIVSGGMDSITLLHDIHSQGEELHAISFDYNQRHQKEIRFAKLNCEKLNIPHKIISLSILNDIAPSSLTRIEPQIPEGQYDGENMKQTVVPNRNMVMLSLAASYAIGIGATKLYYGAHSGDHTIYPDCRPEFVEAISKTLFLCDWHPIELKVPYLHGNKTTILKRGLELGVDYSQTWTCYNGREMACGKCGSCDERLAAFRELGIKDPLEYE